MLGSISRSDVLPPTTVRKRVKESDEWQEAMMDGFERIGVEQFFENFKFNNYYRMVDGKMSYQELSEVIPHLDSLQDLLNGVGIPTFLKHYDILGVIVNLLVGKYIELQDKFHVTDTGEIATNEFIRFKSQEIEGTLQKLIENEMQMHLAQNGLDPNDQQFASEEEQQQFIAKLEEVRKTLIPKDTENDAKKSFKTIGVQWGEATLDRDKIAFNLLKYEKEEFRDKFLTGRCFREYKISADSYYPKTWSPKNVFIPKEIETSRAQDGEYIGRIQIYTPGECIREYGHLMSANTQSELLGGNKGWKNFVSDGFVGSTGTVKEALEHNFNRPGTVPFANFDDYMFMANLEDNLGYPLATYTSFDADGTETTQDRFIPRYLNSNAGQYSLYAKILNDNFEPRKDNCQVTEVYFKARELWGYLTYETETGMIVTEEVTEDLLEDFIKENGIKQKFTETILENVEDFPLNTIIWTWRPVCYEGVKIQSGNLKKPLYLYCRRCEHQIKGDSEFDVKLPVAGYIGKSDAAKIEPYQAKYNLCMNQIYNLLEKELGTFFLMDVAMIPSEFAGWGDAQESLLALRNMAKNTGIMPVATAIDGQRNESNFNQFSTYDISYTNQIQNRVALADFCQRKAYEAIGVNPVAMSQAPKYTTSTGVQISNEISYTQISEIYEDFSAYNQGALELHLSVAQYCQSNNKDITLFYTKSDASIEYLKVTDPEFPFRRIGLIPAVDGRKRKELEEFKQHLKNNILPGSDTLELARLFSSDSMSEIIEIARIERENRQRQESEQYGREQALIERQGEISKELLEDQWNKDEISKQRDRDTDVEVAQISALGRAADKKSDQQGIQQINKQAEIALKDRDITQQYETTAKELQLREKADQDKKELAWAKFNQQAKDTQVRINEMRSKEQIAAINKN